MAMMRISSNKFWGWVVASLVVGLGIGLVIMMLRTGTLTSRITTLENQVGAAGTESSGTVALQGQLASAEASLTVLADQNAQLAADLAAAQSSGANPPPAQTTTPVIAVTSRKVTPSSANASATITLTVKVTGSPTGVTMRIYNSSKSYDKTFTLHKSSTSGGTQTWHATTKAPGKAGSYHYYATATKGSVHVTMVGASPSLLTIK